MSIIAGEPLVVNSGDSGEMRELEERLAYIQDSMAETYNTINKCDPPVRYSLEDLDYYFWSSAPYMPYTEIKLNNRSGHLVLLNGLMLNNLPNLPDGDIIDEDNHTYKSSPTYYQPLNGEIMWPWCLTETFLPLENNASVTLKIPCALEIPYYLNKSFVQSIKDAYMMSMPVWICIPDLWEQGTDYVTPVAEFVSKNTPRELYIVDSGLQYYGTANRISTPLAQMVISGRMQSNQEWNFTEDGPYWGKYYNDNDVLVDGFYGAEFNITVQNIDNIYKCWKY